MKSVWFKEEIILDKKDFPVALSPRNKDILLIQMDGLMTKEEILKALDYIENSADKIKELEKGALEEAINKLE